MAGLPLASGSQLLAWMRQTNTQRTVFPFSSAVPTAPFFRTTQEWPEADQWTGDAIASWEAVILPKDPLAREKFLSDPMSQSLIWPAVPERSFLSDNAGDILTGVLVGVILWLLLSG